MLFRSGAVAATAPQYCQNLSAPIKGHQITVKAKLGLSQKSKTVYLCVDATDVSPSPSPSASPSSSPSTLSVILSGKVNGTVDWSEIGVVGGVPLNVDLRAVVDDPSPGVNITYRYYFDCKNDGSYEDDYTTASASYFKNNICPYTAGTYNAFVKVEKFKQPAFGSPILVGTVTDTLPITASGGPPSGLTATPGCSATDQPQVTLSWTGSGTGWYVDISTVSTFPLAFFWNKSVDNQTSTLAPDGFSNNPISGPLILNPGTTYYWRIYYGVPGNWVYPPSSSLPPGTPFSVPNCVAPQFDLSASFVPGSWNKQLFAANEVATAKVRVASTNLSNINSPSTTLGIWPGQAGEPAFPNCPGSSSSPPAGQSYSVAVLTPNSSQDIDISFNVGSTLGTYTADAYVIPDCSQADVDWTNNSSTAPLNISFAYRVDVAAWFETKDGDVGSSGEINASLAPPGPPTVPSQKYNSTYLLASVEGQTNVLGENGWVIKNYKDPTTNVPHRLIPAGTTVYGYLAGKFRQKAIDEGYKPGGDPCTISAGSLPGSKVFGYCSGNAVFNAGNAPQGNQVWFIDGDLTISKDLVLAGGDAIIFIVAGNITINTDVTQADGIYIAGETFSDGTGSVDETLVINGAVYAKQVSLGRALSNQAGCVPACDNTKTPAEIINFVPKYLVLLSELLGSQQLSWREVAP